MEGPSRQRLLLALLLNLLACGVLADSRCRVCITVFKAIGDLGSDSTNCTKLATFSAFFFLDTTGGLPDIEFFACDPTAANGSGLSPTTITACTTTDYSTAAALYGVFDQQFSELYFFLPFGVEAIDTCNYPADAPINRKNVSLSAECTGWEPSVKLPPVTSCIRPSPPPQSHCQDGQTGSDASGGRMTINLRKWLPGR